MPLQSFNPSNSFQIPGMGDVTTGAEAQARTMEIAARGASNIAQVLQQRAAETAQLTGATAGAKDASQYDAAGNLLPLTTLPDDMSAYSQSYRQAALSVYTSAAMAQARNKANQLALDPENQADPERYRSQWNAYQTETLSKTAPQVQAVLTPQMVDTGGAAYTQILDNYIKTTRAQAGAGAENDLSAMIATTQERLDPMGDTPAAREVIANTIQTQGADILKRMYGADHIKYSPEVLQGKLKATAQSLYSSMAGSQAAQLGGTLVTDADGKIHGDHDKLEQYIQALRQDPTISGLYNDQEFNSMIADPAEVRFKIAESGQKGQIVQQAVERDSKISADLGNLHALATQAEGLWKQRYDITGVLAVIKQAQNTVFSANGDEDTKQRAAFLNGLGDMVMQTKNDPNALEEMRIVGQALDSHGINNGFRVPDTKAGTQALNTLQMIFDSRVAQDIPGGVMSMTNDPALMVKYLADPHQSFYAATGRAATSRMIAEMSDSMTNYTVEQANNIYENYKTLMAVAPDELHASLSKEAEQNINLWHDVGGDPAEYTRQKSVMNAKIRNGAYEENAGQVWDNYGKDPEKAGQDLIGALNNGITNSAMPVALGRSLLGFPPSATASYIPGFASQGIFGIAVPAGGLRSFFGYGPTGDFRVNIDGNTQRAWKTAVSEAAGNGYPGEQAAKMALGYMANQKYALSKLLMPTGLNVGAPGSWRDMTQDLTYGQYAPEVYYNATPATLTDDISISATQWAKQPQVSEAYTSADSLLHPDITALGSKMHWAEEAQAGRLKMEPVIGAGGKLMGYNVLGLVLGSSAYHWVQLNPQGKPYNYDPKSGPLAQEKLVGVKEGRDAAIAMEKQTEAAGPVVSHLAGQVEAAGTTALTGELTREQQIQKDIMGGGSDKLRKLHETLFGGGSQPLSAPPSDILKDDGKK